MGDFLLTFVCEGQVKVRENAVWRGQSKWKPLKLDECGSDPQHHELTSSK